MSYFQNTALFYFRTSINLYSFGFSPVSATCKAIFDSKMGGGPSDLFKAAACVASMLFTVPFSFMTTIPLALIVGCLLLISAPFALTGAAIVDAVAPTPKYQGV